MPYVKAESLPFTTKVFTYLPYFVAIAFSYSRVLVAQVLSFLGTEKYRDTLNRKGYAPLVKDFNIFFERWMYRRIGDLFARPINDIPGGYTSVMLRSGIEKSLVQPLKVTGESKKCLNLGSYNYLGFAQNTGMPVDETEKSIRDWGITPSSSRMELGNTTVHRELERYIAKFLDKEDAIVFGMGYATNSTTIPALCKHGDLVISDMLNHASIVVGCRSGGAQVRVFKHNDPKHLEHVITKALTEGQPRTHLPWNKILIVVEGIYSMEGEILKLKDIIRIKKKYGCYLYVDEAHSIGALGPHGRGVIDYYDVPSSDVDILMGTFTKSFNACGGYICASKELIKYLRTTSFASVSDVSMPVPIATQVLSVLKILMGEDGTDEGSRRLKQLRDNTHHFRTKLREMGFLIIGHYDSPVIPLMIMQPSKMPAFSRLCLERDIAVVMASYPATELELSRARFCMSSAHTIEDLDMALEHLKEVGKVCMLLYDKNDPVFKSCNE